MAPSGDDDDTRGRRAAVLLGEARRRALGAWATGLALAAVVIGLVLFAVLSGGPPTSPTPQLSSVSGRPRRPRRRRAAGRHPRPSPRPAARDVADLWARTAELEAASVDAFVELAADLAAVGAPEELVTRSLEAAADEVRHARTCRWLVRNVGGDPGPPRRTTDPTSPAGDAPHRRPRGLRRQAAIARLGAESFVDGVVGEGLGAALLRTGGATAAPGLDAALRRMARDEERHAALAEDVVRWCVDVAPLLTKPALLGASRHVRRRRTTTGLPSGIDPIVLRRGGFADEDATRALEAAHLASCGRWVTEVAAPPRRRSPQCVEHVVGVEGT